MRLAGWAAMAAMIMVAGCDDTTGPVEAKVVEAKVIEAAAARRPAGVACDSVSFEGDSFIRCIAEPGRHRIETRLADRSGAPLRGLGRLADVMGEAPVAFAMNGGMFDEAGQPIGYYVEGGKRLHTLNRQDGGGNFHLKPNGVFFGTGDRWRIMTAEKFADTVTKRPAFGTQSGPMLVIDGKLHPKIAPNGDSLKRRNAVGVDDAGRAHFVIAEGPVSFGRLARLLRDVEHTPNALFLDGSVSALWDPAAHRMDEGWPLGPLIVVTAIKPAPAAKSAPEGGAKSGPAGEAKSAPKTAPHSSGG